MNYWLFIIPFVSAFLGWIGTRIAGKILIYNILPKRQKQIAEGIGKTVLASFSFADVDKKINDPENVKKLLPVIEAHIDDFLRNKLKTKIPMIGMLIGEKTISSLREVFLNEIEELFPQLLKTFSGNLQRDIDVEGIVVKRINSISPAQMEKAFIPVLRYFSLAGAIIGLLIGVMNVCFFLIIK